MRLVQLIKKNSVQEELVQETIPEENDQEVQSRAKQWASSDRIAPKKKNDLQVDIKICLSWSHNSEVEGERGSTLFVGSYLHN